MAARCSQHRSPTLRPGWTGRPSSPSADRIPRSTGWRRRKPEARPSPVVPGPRVRTRQRSEMFACSRVQPPAPRLPAALVHTVVRLRGAAPSVSYVDSRPARRDGFVRRLLVGPATGCVVRRTGRDYVTIPVLSHRGRRPLWNITALGQAGRSKSTMPRRCASPPRRAAPGHPRSRQPESGCTSRAWIPVPPHLA